MLLHHDDHHTHSYHIVRANGSFYFSIIISQLAITDRASRRISIP